MAKLIPAAPTLLPGREAAMAHIVQPGWDPQALFIYIVFPAGTEGEKGWKLRQRKAFICSCWHLRFASRSHYSSRLDALLMELISGGGGLAVSPRGTWVSV